MAGLQSWPRQTQLSRPTDNAHIYHGRTNDVAPAHNTSYSTSPGADESKLRPRPRRSLATFTSYLATHHRMVSPSSGSEWPSIDWSKLSINDKDGVYKRDVELMCTTITQQVLANPSTDLPAQYNTFLLQLIEAYHQSKVDVQDLQMKLAEQTECNKTTVDAFEGGISSWPLEKTQMPESLENPENANSNTLHSTRCVKEVIATRILKHNSAIQMPSSSIDIINKGKKQGQADTIKTSERHQSISSGSRHRDPCTAAMGIESSHDHWPPLPLQHGMELINCDSSRPDSEGEEPRVLMSASDAFLGLENDVTSRIAGWLALRLKHQPSDFISELSEFVRSNQEGMQNGLAPITSCSIRPNMPSAYGKLSLGRNQRLQGRPDKLIPTNGPLSYQPIRASRDRRGFSLLPGDDSANRTISNAFRDRALDSATSFFRPLAWQDRKHREHGELGKSSKDKLSGVMAADSKSQQGLTKSIPSLTAGSGVSRNSQRDGSGNSVLTAITSSSGRSSSRSHRGSLSSNAENNGLRVCSSRSGNSRLAVAAARAANGTVDRGASYRESRS